MLYSVYIVLFPDMHGKSRVYLIIDKQYFDTIFTIIELWWPLR